MQYHSLSADEELLLGAIRVRVLEVNGDEVLLEIEGLGEEWVADDAAINHTASRQALAGVGC